MNMKLMSLLTLSCLLAVACKKEYSCECKNPGGVYATYSITDSKSKAKKKCDDYAKENENTVFSESSCSVK